MATIKNSYPKEDENTVARNNVDFDLTTRKCFPMVSFHDVNNSNKQIGRLDIKEGKIHFEGDMTESAQIFFNHLKELWDRQSDANKPE